MLAEGFEAHHLRLVPAADMIAGPALPDGSAQTAGSQGRYSLPGDPPGLASAQVRRPSVRADEPERQRFCGAGPTVQHVQQFLSEGRPSPRQENFHTKDMTKVSVIIKSAFQFLWEIIPYQEKPEC